MSKLLPYETIVKAHEGDPDAIDTVLSHYAGYIRYFSKVNGQEMALPLGRTGTVIGDVRLEGTASAVDNDGFFEVFRERGGTHLFAGHDHNNNFITEYRGVTLGYMTKSSYNCYFTFDVLGGTLLTLDQDNQVREEILSF